MRILLCLLLLTASPAWAADREWNTTDTVLQVLFTVLLEVDREQTQWMRQHRRVTLPSGAIATTTDINPALGPEPSADHINSYFAGAAVAHAAISYALRRSGWEPFGIPAVTAWQSISIGVQAGQSAQNYALGYRMAF